MYIDVDNTTVGGLDANDIILGAVTAEVLSGAKGTMTVGSLDIAPGTYTTALTDAGSILFRVIAPNAAGAYVNLNTVSSTVLNVKVK
ncbi:hypothetical protein [Psychrobacillus sp. NPDC096623]|uniref:hypothetical protein n=1 Tax=Psychrobacillus sp. NPDC096623 TaxID=3364492 RepID=UPI003802303E